MTSYFMLRMCYRCCQCFAIASATLLQEVSQAHDAAHSLAEGIMIKHSLKEQRSSLQVTVLEAKGLTPRKGQHVMLAEIACKTLNPSS